MLDARDRRCRPAAPRRGSQRASRRCRSGNASSTAAMNMSPATPPMASRWICMRWISDARLGMDCLSRTAADRGPFIPRSLAQDERPVTRAAGVQAGACSCCLRQHRIESTLGVELERLGLARPLRTAPDWRAPASCSGSDTWMSTSSRVLRMRTILHVLRLDPHHRLHREADRVFVGVHDHRDHAAVEIGAGDDVRVGLGMSISLYRRMVVTSAHADAAGVAVRFRRQTEHGDLLHQRLRRPTR